MKRVSKKIAKIVLNELYDTIRVDEPRVEDSYARRFRESIKAIFGEKSDFYDSAKKINFLYAHPILSSRPLSENNSISTTGTTRDLLIGCLKKLEDFDTYNPPKN